MTHLEIILRHPRAHVGEVGGEEAGLDGGVVGVESVEMLAQTRHRGRRHREGARPGRHHEIHQPRHVLVRHQAREQLRQLRLQVSV